MAGAAQTMHRIGSAPVKDPGGLAVTLEEWETFSDMNITQAEKERSRSSSLRALVKNLLVQMAADMRTRHETTGSAMLLEEIASQEKG
ncbi:hypothetical protein HF521_015332 [Silurus meridionalis]|uniref:Uncharacterized protein n=1 Tax=Silurus meridionalis TaxID=175797 RepID=A0A8T0A590_SILME|nr:hypothetical protein HF521_015332 [Silurus meridionalis]